MPTDQGHFTIQEAVNRIGRRVRLIAPIDNRLNGETGFVREWLEYRDGYALMVQWDIGWGNGRVRVDVFQAADFPKFLEEA